MKIPNCNWHLFLHKRWYLQQCSQISRKKTPLFLASIPIQGKNVLEGTWQGSAGHWLFETGYIVQWAPSSYFEEMPWKAQTLHDHVRWRLLIFWLQNCMQRAATATSLKIVLLLHEVAKEDFHAVVNTSKKESGELQKFLQETISPRCL